ncbi:MAG: acyl-CoA thioesterase [Gammaproteobacteria bacterium]
MSAEKKTVGRCVHPQRGEPTVQIMAMPRDTNWLGDIFGGWLMSHADMAGAILAYRRAGGKVVTVAIDDFLFLKPVYTGDVVTFFCRLIKVGSSSMKVAVEMVAERPGTGPGEEIKVSQATITYVHIGDDRKPQAIPAEHPR